jgi:hypothetical protein
MKIEIPDFVKKQIDQFYEEDFIEKEKIAKKLLAKAKRDNKRANKNLSMVTQKSIK